MCLDFIRRGDYDYLRKTLLEKGTKVTSNEEYGVIPDDND